MCSVDVHVVRLRQHSVRINCVAELTLEILLEMV